VIAVFNGEKGGTKNTIDYAERQNIPVIYIP
jgi:precorrin-6x reductase